MAEQIFIRLNPDPEQVDWWVLDAQGHRRGGIGTDPLETAARHAPGRRVFVIVPSSPITLTEVRLPTRSKRRWGEAIPFALEDQLAGDVEELHFAYGEPDPSGLIPVAVVARRQMADWMALLEAQGIRPDTLWPDIVLVPWIAGRWSLARSGNQIIFRWGRELGTRLDEPFAEAVFNRLWASSPEETRPGEIVFYGAADDPFLTRLRETPGCETVVWTVSGPSCAEEASRGPLSGLNLLQGPWTPGRRHQEIWTRWKPSIYLASGWAGLLVLAFIALVIQVNHEAGLWHRRLHQAFHAALPGQPYVSPRAQIEQALHQGAGRSARTRALLAFLAHASRSRPPMIRMDSLQYGSTDLMIHLSAPSRALAESYLASLTRTTRMRPVQVHWRAASGQVQASIQYHLGQGRT